MSNVTIRIPTALRKFASGQDHVLVDGQNVREALNGLEVMHPGIKAKICDSDGNLRRFINVYANQEDIRFLDNLDTHLTAGTELQIVPAIAGGH
jgi:molybdopterin synthase sulfur carrier subunit